MSTTSHSGIELLSETGLHVIPQHEADPSNNGAEESRRWSSDQDLGLQVAPRPSTEKYFHKADEARHLPSDQPSTPPVLPKSRRGFLACIAIVAVLCMAVGLGVGVGAGLAIRRKSNPSM